MNNLVINLLSIMKAISHKLCTNLAFDLLKEELNDFPLYSFKNSISDDCVNVDHKNDLEFVDVDFGVDNPHEDYAGWGDDDPHYTDGGPNIAGFNILGKSNHNLTTYNHFIDIRKGAGIYDDFDGYGYQRGSGHKNQNELIAGYGKDHWINYWFNDEYVHALGRQWYRGCSPSIERYSFFRDKNNFSSISEEAINRFPKAESTGEEGNGIPYSVFMSVDNMARYWYWQFKNNRKINAIGYVMHAIQDASIPHHAAGCSGNWHQAYEGSLDFLLMAFIVNPNFKQRIKNLFNLWTNNDDNPPLSLSKNDFNTVPNSNWKIEWIVTWMALNSYQSYKNVYNNFETFEPNNSDIMELTAKSVALCMIALNNLFNYERIKKFEIENLRIFNPSDNVFQVVIFPFPASRFRIGVFSTRENAELALNIIQGYKMNQMNSVNKIFNYFLSNEKAPGIIRNRIPIDITEIPGEQYFDMDINSLHVKTILKVENNIPFNNYLIGDANNTYFDFNDNQYDAILSLYLIKKHRFSRFGWVGSRENPEMTYLLERINNAPANWPHGPFVFRKHSIRNEILIRND